MLLTLLACAPDTALFDDPTAFPERVSALGELNPRLTPGGDPLPSTWLGEDLPVLDWDEGAVRVSTTWLCEGVELALWLDRPNLRAYATGEAAASGGPDHAQQSGVEFEQGTELERVEARGNFRRVRWASPDLEVDAWLPAGGVDELTAPVEDGPSEEEVADDVFLRGGAVLRDEKGRSLATVGGPEVPWRGAWWLETRGDQALVELSAGPVRVTGWVDSEDLSLEPEGGFGWSSCGGLFGTMGCGRFAVHEPNLLEGSLLLADGVVVGKVLQDLWLPLLEGETATEVALPMPWGELLLEVEAPL